MATIDALRPAARGRSRSPAPPTWLVGAGVAVALLGVLPVAYLVILVAGNAEEALSLAIRERTVGVLGRSLLLAATVTTASVLIGVPIAWLTARTDLPGRRWWTILAVLPLVVPSYV